MNRHQLNIAEINELAKQLLHPEKTTDARIASLISINPAQFLIWAQTHPHLQKPLYLQKALILLTKEDAKNDLFYKGFMTRFAQGHFDALLMPFLTGPEGEKIYRHFKMNSNKTPSAFAHISRLTPKHLNTHDIVEFLKQNAKLDLFKDTPAPKRYQAFIKQMNASLGMLELLHESDKEECKTLPTQIKSQIIALFILTDLEKTIQGQEVNAHTFVKQIDQEHTSSSLLQESLNFAYSLLVENIQDRAKDTQTLLTSLEEAGAQLANIYTTVYNKTCHTPSYQEKTWDTLLKAQKSHLYIVHSDGIKPKDKSPHLLDPSKNKKQ